MQRNDIDQEFENEEIEDGVEAPVEAPVEEAEDPVPGIHHEPEPDAENIMPVEDGPGTL